MGGVSRCVSLGNGSPASSSPPPAPSINLVKAARSDSKSCLVLDVVKSFAWRSVVGRAPGSLDGRFPFESRVVLKGAGCAGEGVC